MENLKLAVFPLVGPSYVSRSPTFDAQRCINFFPETHDLGAGKNAQVAALYSCPGLRRVQQLGVGPTRPNGSITVSTGELSYHVIGSQVFQLTSAEGTPVAVSGNLLTDAGPVSMADNGTHLMIVDGLYGYTVDMTAPSPALVQIVDPNFFSADTVTYIEGYFVLDKKGTPFFFHSDVDSIDFPPLNELSALASPDRVVAVVANNNRLYVFGTRTVETWVPSVSGGAPFDRQITYNMGLTAPYSVQRIGTTLIFLGANEQGDGILFSMDNDSPTRISTHAIEWALQQEGDLSTSTAYTAQIDGHYFYYLNTPSGTTTWVYDLMTKMFHEEQSIVESGAIGRRLPTSHCFLNGQHVFGDFRNGNLYVLDYSNYQDNGQPFRRRRITPHLSSGVKNIFPKTMQIDIQAGVGTLTQNPRLSLRVSRDGGFTYGNPIYASMGKQGEYRWRARWQRLGKGRDLVFDVQCDDPVNVVLLAAFLDVEEGTA